MGVLDGITYGEPPAVSTTSTSNPLEGITYGAPAQPATPTEEPGVVESVARGAAQGLTFGFADELTGAIKAAFTDESYASARDKARAAYAAAQAAHPIAFGGAELAAGVAPMLVPGGAVAKAVGLGAKAVEGGEALAAGADAVQGLTKAGKIAADAAKSAAATASDLKTGAALGALSAAGNTEAGYQSDKGGWGQAFKDVAEGAATGGAIQAGLGKVGRTLTEGAVGRATKDLMEVVRGSAPAKFAKKVAGDAEDIESTLFRPENADVLKNLGNTEKAIPLAEARMETIGKELDDLKTELDDVTSKTVYKPAGTSAAEPSLASTSTDLVPTNALARAESGAAPAPRTVTEMRAVQEGGGARLGDIVEPIQDKISELAKQPGNGAEKRALREMLEDVKDSWSPGKYDPDTIVSTKDLRAYTTQTQKLASNTIGTINESLASELKHDLSATVMDILNAHLNRSAATSPEAASIVARMRDLNTQYSAFANMVDAFRGTAWKQMVKSKSASKIIGEGAHNLGLTGAAVAAATGHPLAAAAALGAPIARKLVDKAAVSGNRWLATVYRAAAAGSTKDQLIKLAVEQGAPMAVARYVASKLGS